MHDDREVRFKRGVIILLMLSGMWLEFLFTVVILALLIKGL